MPCVKAIVGILFIFGMIVGCYRGEYFTEPHLTASSSSPTMSSARERIDQVLQHSRENRELNVDVHGAWQVLHGVLAYGKNFEIRVGDRRLPTVEYLFQGGRLDGWELQLGTKFPNGRHGIVAVLAPGSTRGQGHADQWLAYLLWQSTIPLNEKIRVQENNCELNDYLRQVQHDVPWNAEREWSWTLIALSRYLPTSTEWVAGDGKTWNMEFLLSEELKQAGWNAETQTLNPHLLGSAACGGSHRLIGITMVLDRRRAEGMPIQGPWADAETTIELAQQLARNYQNPDGSFSSNYFARPGISVDAAQVLSTTGHTLEFLCLSLDQQALKSEWILRAVHRLCDTLEQTEQLPLDCGALYHALHGLVVFQERTTEEKGTESPTAESPTGESPTGGVEGVVRVR